MTGQAKKDNLNPETEMAKAYDAGQVEDGLYRLWLEGDYFSARTDPAKHPFTIIMPPPNVTGELHLGHALTSTIEDLLIRWHRMKGDPTLWLPGVDHAGIATQNVVEKELLRENLTRHDLGREGFLERVWEWVGRYRHIISQQHQRLGVSCDWSRERFTMDEGPQKAVRTTFVNLYRDGLIYRGERIINWCPRCQTALSDLEVEHKEHADHLWYVRYPLLDESGEPGDEYITIATTRPETIVADVAVAVNPDDPRNKGMIGRTALLPTMDRHIPVVGDAAVEPAFGTGALKITPGHDQVDFEVGERHGLSAIVSVGADGMMNEEAGPYAGQDRFVCRDAIVDDLKAMGLMEKIEPYSHSIGHCQRCDTIIEPVVSQQWFVSMKPLAEPAMAAVKDGRIKIVPRRFTRVYLHWMENIRDWCISRQLWWGHRIPVWYCDDCGEITVALEDPSQCEYCASGSIHQDPDVLDTWFSSALWPHSTLGWPDDTEDLRYFYPTTVMETGYDILFFWVARMIMMGLYNTGDVPFRHVYLHGLLRDRDGRKMTKSLGNVVDPVEAAAKYGTDALRFVLATGGAPGNDMRISDERLEGGRNFANKVWNAARFVITSLGDKAVEPPKPGARDNMALEDRWIMSRLHRLIGDAGKLLPAFQVGEAGRQIHDFFWGEFCDWYIEMAKVRLNAGNPSPLPILAHVLDTSLRLLHPFVPFVTEAIWQNLRSHLRRPEVEALIAAPWPKASKRWRDEEAERQAEAMMDVVRAIRNIRAERGVEPARCVEAYLVADGMRGAAEASRLMIETLARVRPLHIVDGTAAAPRERVITAVLRDVQVVLPLAGLFDVEAERARLRRQVDDAQAEVTRLKAKLANEQFRTRAPATVVDKEEDKLAAARARLEGLQARLKELT
ncbi:MAG: valine--tRNA ligase [Dehalococcoidia bacterium]|nr:MAG: valine--tRNA ligase [Dehalococcoidia bacterium]